MEVNKQTRSPRHALKPEQPAHRALPSAAPNGLQEQSGFASTNIYAVEG